MAPRDKPGGTGIRPLEVRDEAVLRRFLARNLVERVFVAARVEALGLRRMGCRVWGWFEDGVLRSVCHEGANVMAIASDDRALAAFAAKVGERPRTCSSLVGEAAQTMELFRQLVEMDESWAEPREIRPSQPMLAISEDPLIPGDPRVRRTEMSDFARYFEASVAMYTEEVGVSPVAGASRGYMQHVRTLIETGRAFGIFDRDRVVFKADLGSTAGHVAQVQGVWVDPAYRGQHLAAPAMASVVRLTRRRFPTVSLYVNDFNLPARATYARCGFEQVGEFATVLY